MYIERLKSKYKEILQSSRTTKDENLQETSKSYHGRVLTEYNENSYKGSNVDTSVAYVIALKERLAQAMQNLTKKQSENASLKEQISRKQVQIKVLQATGQNHNLLLDGHEKKLAQARSIIAEKQNYSQSLKQQLEALTIDRQLSLKQVEYYKAETTKLGKEKKSQQKTIDSLNKTIKENELTKNQNTLLRDDIKRMQNIINEIGAKKGNFEYTNKHFLGKPQKESDMWFPQNLVNEVEQFLRKQQLGVGNKKFQTNLIKFISKTLSSSAKSKASSNTNSRVRSSGKSSHCRSSSMCDPGISSMICDLEHPLSIKKTEGMSVLKKSLMMNKYRKRDSKKFQSSSDFKANMQEVDMIEQVLKEFRKVVEQVCDKRNFDCKLILNLTDEMISTLESILESLKVSTIL